MLRMNGSAFSLYKGLVSLLIHKFFSDVPSIDLILGLKLYFLVINALNVFLVGAWIVNSAVSNALETPKTWNRLSVQHGNSWKTWEKLWKLGFGLEGLTDNLVLLVFWYPQATIHSWKASLNRYPLAVFFGCWTYVTKSCSQSEFLFLG